MKIFKRLDRSALFALAGLVVLNLTILAADAAGLRINTTASMPLGVYRVTAYHSGPIARDALVTVCPSEAMLAVAIPRGYLGPGACPGNVEPLLKHVAAVGGDRVDVSDRAVSVNGEALPRSGRLRNDCDGRPLPRIPAGRYTLRAGNIWLYAPVARSWDSRYFGPQAATHVIGIATAVLIVGEGQACKA
jgi:conjugative transfer signal peptidase TraF